VSAKDIEVVRRLNEQFNRDGWNALWRIADPDIEFCEPPEQPGASVFRGLEAKPDRRFGAHSGVRFLGLTAP
jgi:hypothetical protein